MNRRQVCIGNPLLPVGVAREIHKVVAALSGWQNLENLLALRALSRKPAGTGETHFCQRAIMKVNLILDRNEVQVLTSIDRGLNRVEKREPVPSVIPIVNQQAAGKNVRRRQIHLQPREIAAAQRPAAVLPVRQLADGVHAVEAVESIVKPGPAFGNGSGNLDARRPLVDVKACFGADAGKKVGSAEAPAV